MLVMRILLHVLWISLHVHHDVGYFQFCHSGKHVCIQVTGRNVIDDCRTVFFYTHSGYVGAESVDGNNGIRELSLDNL